MRFLVPVLLLVMAACGPLPRPFKAAEGQGIESPFDASRDSAGIVIAPVVGAPPVFAGPLADMLAEKLAGKGIPATTGGAIRNAYLLEGVTAGPAVDGQLAIDWNLSDQAGSIVSGFSTRHALPSDAMQTGAADSIDAIAKVVAVAVSDSLLGPAVVAQAVPERLPPGIAVVAVEGAPGDGNAALKTAFEAVLRRAGLPVVDDPAQAAIRIFGKVDLTPAGNGTEDLLIAWTLRDPDGAEIGVLTQSNAVPQGKLDVEWGSLAYDITIAMIDGVARVLHVIDDAEDIRRR